MDTHSENGQLLHVSVSIYSPEQTAAHLTPLQLRSHSLLPIRLDKSRIIRSLHAALFHGRLSFRQLLQWTLCRSSHELHPIPLATSH